MMSHLISPSVLSADFANLQRDIEMINSSVADWFHLDIMDGNFVPNLSFGLPVVEHIRKHALKPLDVHLMIDKPERYVTAFKKAGADILTVHYEATNHLHSTIGAIKNAGMKAGVSLNPHTPVCLLEDIVQDLDLVLIMSVNPGFGGQKFIARTYEKLASLVELLKRKKVSPMIEVDGGVDISNARKLVDAGANVLVSGSHVFNSANPVGTIANLKNC